MSADFLSTPLSYAFNNSILKGKFLDNAKVACASPLDKHTENKYSVSNLRPASVINIFSKIYENVLENMLVEKMNDHFSLSLQLIDKAIILNMYLFDFWKNGGCPWITIILLEL